MLKIFRWVWFLPRNIMIGVVKIYQNTLSPDHAGILKIFYPHGFCRFSPSCSEYSKKAFQKYGFVLGLIKSVWRILRCNPWNKGGDDPA